MRITRKLISSIGITIMLNFILVTVCFAKYTAVASYPGWTTISVPGLMIFQMPPTMEIQSEGYKRKMDKVGGPLYELVKVANSVSEFRFIANQRGLNAGTESAYRHFARVIVSVAPAAGLAGQNGKIDLTGADLIELKPYYQKFIEIGMNLDPRFHFTMNYFYPLTIQQIANREAMLIKYIRTMDNNPPAIVRRYTFYGKRIDLSVEISYWSNERNIWEAPGYDLRDIINTVYFYNEL